MTSNAPTLDNSKAPSSLVPMAIIGTLFFIFGFVTWLNGALIPFLQIVCDLTETQALYVAFCFYFAYVVMALPMSKILEKTGYKNGMALGLLIIAAGLVLFVPAALTREFSIFLIAQFIVGTGLTILQTASNPYIVKIGPQESAAARIAIMGLLNKGAGVIAPIVFTALVLGEFAGISMASIEQLTAAERESQIQAMSSQLIWPYVGMAIALIVLTFGLFKSSLPELQSEEEHVESNSEANAKTNILQFPQLVLGALALFFYVGVEVIAGDTIGLYGSKLGLENATSLTSYTMAAMVLGYLLGLILIPKYLSQPKALLLSAIAGIVITTLILVGSDTSTSIADVLWGWTGASVLPNTVTLVAILGLANAMVWPAIWPLALDGLGKFTPTGSAILIMGIAGGAILPLGYGVAAEEFGGQLGYMVMIPCYLFIALYALKGYAMRSWK